MCLADHTIYDELFTKLSVLSFLMWIILLMAFMVILMGHDSGTQITSTSYEIGKDKNGIYVVLEGRKHGIQFESSIKIDNEDFVTYRKVTYSDTDFDLFDVQVTVSLETAAKLGIVEDKPIEIPIGTLIDNQ